MFWSSAQQALEGVTVVVDATGEKRMIVVSSRFLNELTDEAIEVLVEANDPPTVFVHGDVLARIRRGEVTVLEPFSQAALKGHLDRVAEWVNLTSKGGVSPSRPPHDVVSDIRAMESWPGFPKVEAVVHAPVVAADGSIHRSVGYNASSRVYLDLPSGLMVPEVPDRPSRQQIEAAVALIREELLVDFPFASDADRANAIGLLLLPFARRLIDGPTPLHLIEAPTPGTGKGLLTEVLLSPSRGRGVPLMSAGRSEDEWRKGLTAKFVGGSDLIVIDNLSDHLESGTLAAALTVLTWEDRLLGVSRMVHFPVRCCWVATGNNPTTSTEMARRSVRIRLSAITDRPWERTGFRHPDLAGFAHRHRGELIHAALTLIRNWLVKGRPEGSQKHLGTFEDWSRIIGGILETAGIEGFDGNRDELHQASDAEATALSRFVTEWEAAYGIARVGTADLYVIAAPFNGVLFDLGTGSEHSRKVKLGIALNKLRDRRSNGYRIDIAGTKQGATQYQLSADTPS